MALSLCTRCLARVQGKILFEDDRVWLDKRCPEHGPERVLLADDIDYYRRTREAFLAPGGRPLANQTGTLRGCPFDCGLCPDHEQHTCVALLEVTDSCNLRCPVCYAGSGPERTGFRSLAEVDAMLGALARSEEKLNVLQVSGGEPTLHPDFFAILDRARRAPVRHLMVNTNGLRIAADRSFAERLAGYRPDFEVYLQFDSLRPGPLRALRGADLLDTKKRALDTLGDLGISTTLVATLVRGVNDDEVGDLVRFALGQPCVRGLTLQPVQVAGRCEGFDPGAGRLTLTEVRRRVVEQSGVFRAEDVVPVPCHSECMAMAYAFKLGGGVIPLTGLLDPQVLARAGGSNITFESDPAMARALFEAFSAGHSPSSNAEALRELLRCVPDARSLGTLTYANVFRLMIVAFLDAASFDVRAVKRSCVHIVHPDGRIIPFDTYNLFHREGRSHPAASAAP